MKYSRFEQLIVAAGSLAILGSLALSLTGGGPGYEETIAQLMLFMTLVAAVHYGRKGGMVTAIAAATIYVLLRIPLLSSADGVSSTALIMVVSRLAAYGIVGVIGGELFGRIKYVFARFENSGTVDDWSRVYNQRYAFRAIEQAQARFTRYGEPFSLLLLTLSPSLTSELRPSRQRTLVRGVANYIRGDVRMVDEVSRLGDGRFTVLLPHTPREGGMVVCNRVAAGVRQTLGSRVESVSCECYGAAEDSVAMVALLADIAPTEPADS